VYDFNNNNNTNYSRVYFKDFWDFTTPLPLRSMGLLNPARESWERYKLPTNGVWGKAPAEIGF